MYKTNGSHGKGPSVFSPKGMDIYEIDLFPIAP